jgi:hypothetical protein
MKARFVIVTNSRGCGDTAELLEVLDGITKRGKALGQVYDL